MKRIYVNEKWCLGCHLCEYECAFAATGLSDMAKALKGKTIHPRITVEDGGDVHFAVNCRHCRDAVGDCTESFDLTSGTRRVLALLPNAYAQGFCAGVNMAGGDARFDAAMPLNAIDFFGSHILTAGSYAGEGFAECEGERYRKFFVEDGVLKGFILVNAPERAGIYTALVRNRTPLSQVDCEQLKAGPALAAFPQEARAAMLAREV